VERTISADGGPRRVVVTEGDLVELEVTSSQLDSVMLMDEIEPVEPRSGARFHLLADRPDEYPITLLEADRQIGTLVVRGSR
jgi:hypothetical protein